MPAETRSFPASHFRGQIRAGKKEDAIETFFPGGEGGHHHDQRVAEIGPVQETVVDLAAGWGGVLVELGAGGECVFENGAAIGR